MERRTGKIHGAFSRMQRAWTAGCWLARRLHQLKASTTMDLGISIFLIFVRCVALRNLELLIKTGWNVFKKNLNASKPSEHPPQVEECLKV